MKVQLISPLPDDGFAFNAGSYWPLGLLTIATVLRRFGDHVDVEILDESLIGKAELERCMGADVVGIQASSSLTYRRVLQVASLAKERFGAYVVIGGPYATTMARQILQCRTFVDAVVEGAGEAAMLQIVKSLGGGRGEPEVVAAPGLWLRVNGVVTPPRMLGNLNYDEILPLDYSLIPVAAYHVNYCERLAPGSYQGAFQIFTHFGCKYRDARRAAGQSWCLYCALGDQLVVRDPHSIRREIEDTLLSCGMSRHGAKIMLKCYGDNASALGPHLERLAEAIRQSSMLREFNLRWSVYAQSCYITERLVDVFWRLGVAEVYVGFDSVDDAVQRLNGLGTTKNTHLRAARLLQEAGVRLQAGFVLGCEGETPETLDATIQFCHQIAALDNVDLFHASPLVVLAGSEAFNRLAHLMPEIVATDYIEPQVLQREWLARFCPGLGPDGQGLIRDAAQTIATLGEIRSGWGQSDKSEASKVSTHVHDLLPVREMSRPRASPVAERLRQPT